MPLFGRKGTIDMRPLLRPTLVTTFTFALSFVALLVSVTSARAEVLPLNWRDAIPLRLPRIAQPDHIATLAVDLRPEIARRGLHIRDQGERGTCTVFATTFLIEYQLAGQMPNSRGVKLSEEFLN